MNKRVADLLAHWPSHCLGGEPRLGSLHSINGLKGAGSGGRDGGVQRSLQCCTAKPMTVGNARREISCDNNGMPGSLADACPANPLCGWEKAQALRLQH